MEFKPFASNENACIALLYWKREELAWLEE
mgnify:CR=1 FL=1